MIQMLDTALNMLVSCVFCHVMNMIHCLRPVVETNTVQFALSNRLQGPDIELLTEIMEELGVKHIRYGVRPDMFPMMGEALVETLEASLGDDFNENVREAWREVYAELSQDMVKAQLKK
jgi:hemoglobin-like flavoprotein